jgi:hypothetical protein
MTNWRIEPNEKVFSIHSPSILHGVGLHATHPTTTMHQPFKIHYHTLVVDE